MNATYGEACNESSQCQLNMGIGGQCANNKCSCQNDYVRVNIKTGNITRYLCENRIGKYRMNIKIRIIGIFFVQKNYFIALKFCEKKEEKITKNTCIKLLKE